MKPYVGKEVKIDTRDGTWPVADSKKDLYSKRGGLFGEKGFDGRYYIQLAEFMKENKQ